MSVRKIHKSLPPPPLSVASEEQKNTIEAMAGTGFTPAQIAEVLEVDIDIFLQAFNARREDIYKPFRKGLLQAEFELRRRIFKDAGHGSSPAQTMAKRILEELNFKLEHNGGK